MLLANALTFARGMNSEETKKDELTDTGREVKENPESPETAEQHWPEDEEVISHEQKLKEEQEKYLRLYSEFENFRRRTAKERIDLLQTAGREVISAMLPVLDDFERALKSSEMLKQEHASLLEGFELIARKMSGIMESMGLKPMKSVGELFDAEVHEAVTKIPAPSEEMKGRVIDEVEKGYYLNDKVIRFAKVVVGE